jgi:hypothetical protein
MSTPSKRRQHQAAEIPPNRTRVPAKFGEPSQVPPKNHRYRIGRVQRGVRRAFLLAPEWTTRELMEWTHALALYRGRRSRWQRHDYAKSVRRAADQVAVRLGRRWPDGVLWRLK